MAQSTAKLMEHYQNIESNLEHLEPTTLFNEKH